MYAHAVTKITGCQDERSYSRTSAMAWLSRLIVRTLERIARPRSKKSLGRADHLALGQRGETEAFVYLQKLGYKLVATNFRTANDRGEIDLIGWDDGVLCFVEVKTRTDQSFAAPSTAVTHDKQKHIVSVARRYVRRLAGVRSTACRFDIVSVVPATDGQPEISVQKGAFSWDAGRRPKRRERFQSNERRFWRRK